MTDFNDPGYYRRREQTERELADKARDPQISRIHRELADRYAVQVRAAARRTTLQIAV